MMIMLHVIIALLSILSATLTLIFPKRVFLSVSYALVAGTLISGAYLVVLAPEVMAHVCVSGLVYLAAVSVMLAMARSKLMLSRQ